MARFHRSIDACLDDLFKLLPGEIRMGAPLGLGKPVDLLNTLYDRIQSQPDRQLHLYTALSLSVPHPKGLLEERFLGPFLDRHYKKYPGLDYARDIIQHKLAKNVRVHEFYMQAGVYPKDSVSQRDYVSLNYTHVAQYLVEEDIQVIVQMVAANVDKTRFSLSCNPDMTLDLRDLYKQNKKQLIVIGVIHPDLPYLGHDAEVDAEFFDMILDTPQTHALFAMPRMPVQTEDIWIGLHASRLVKDDGTIQIGIGSLSESLVKALVVRQKNNALYKSVFNELPFPKKLYAETGTFHHGLYGVSEMLMDGFMHLYEAGILKRRIFDHDGKKKRFLHAAFFLGSKVLYQWLRELPPEAHEGLDMTRVSKVNDLYDANEFALRRQRKNARFFNTSMAVTLLGGAVSDTLEDGHVISGVGGQFNFVSMAKELPDSHSVLMLRSTRKVRGIAVSNIVWSQGNQTIPRHLRDVVVTEYGVAFLRGATDEQVIQRLLEITDSRFQDKLMEEAKASKKLSADYRIPGHARNNTPERLEAELKPHREHFPAFPFGSDFNEVEQKIIPALGQLKESADIKLDLAKLLKQGLFLQPADYRDELERLQLLKPKTLEEKLYQKLVMAALEAKRST